MNTFLLLKQKFSIKTAEVVTGKMPSQARCLCHKDTEERGRDREKS